MANLLNLHTDNLFHPDHTSGDAQLGLGRLFWLYVLDFDETQPPTITLTVNGAIAQDAIAIQLTASADVVLYERQVLYSPNDSILLVVQQNVTVTTSLTTVSILSAEGAISDGATLSVLPLVPLLSHDSGGTPGVNNRFQDIFNKTNQIFAGREIDGGNWSASLGGTLRRNDPGVAALQLAEETGRKIYCELRGMPYDNCGEIRGSYQYTAAIQSSNLNSPLDFESLDVSLAVDLPTAYRVLGKPDSDAISFSNYEYYGDTESIPGVTDEFDGWAGGVLASNGFIYCAPYTVKPTDPAKVLKINPTNNTLSTIDVSPTNTDRDRWRNPIIASDGLFYCAPQRERTILRIDTATDTVATFGSFNSGAAAIRNNKFSHIVDGGNGFLYLIPAQWRDIVKFEIATQTITEISGTDFDYSGGVLVGNRIFLVPDEADDIGVFNITTELMEAPIPVTSTQGSTQWGVPLLATNGKIYAPGFREPNILEIDPVTLSARTIGDFNTLIPGGSNNPEIHGMTQIDSNTLYLMGDTTGDEFQISFLFDILTEVFTVLPEFIVNRPRQKFYGCVWNESIQKVHFIPHRNTELINVVFS